MAHTRELSEVRFAGEYPHARGNIPLLPLGTFPASGITMIWGIEAGSVYPPEQHRHPHNLIIIEGTGILSLNGEDIPYQRGSMFWIEGNVPHGFIRVDTATIVVEQQR